MRRTRTALASGIISALIVAGLLAAPAPASAAWKLLDCAPTPVRGAKICLYRDTQNSNQAQGRYINNSGIDLRTQGSFWRNTGHEAGCSVSTTEAGTTSVCTRTLSRGRHYLLGSTAKGDEFLGFTATGSFAFGG